MPDAPELDEPRASRVRSSLTGLRRRGEVLAAGTRGAPPLPAILALPAEAVAAELESKALSSLLPPRGRGGEEIAGAASDDTTAPVALRLRPTVPPSDGVGSANVTFGAPDDNDDALSGRVGVLERGGGPGG